MKRAVREIWKERFGDSDDYTRFFLERRFDSDDVFVALEKGDVAGMAFAASAALRVSPGGADSMPVAYVYGVATAKAYHNTGVATAILEHIQKSRPNNILVPADAGLAEFYKKRGYRAAFYHRVIEFGLDPVSGDDFSADEAEPDEYAEIRARAFSREGDICWPKPYVAFMLEENGIRGGRSLIIRKRLKEPEIITYRVEGDTALILETSAAGETLREAARNIMLSAGAVKCRARLHPALCREGRLTPYGMASARLPVESGYISLVPE
jgi:GNAT superfamily N-acetyltransferase